MSLLRGHLTLAVLLAVAAVALLSTTFLIGSSPDEEEFRFAVLAAWLRVRALADGHHAFWTPLLGLGIPQPFVPNFALHPLAPLMVWLTPVAWMRLVLFVHTVIGAAGMWELCRRLEVKPLARAMAVTAFLLATPTQNYLLSDFWPSHFVMWTASPWVLLLAWRVLDDSMPPDPRWSIGLGLIGGLAVANTNPGYAASYTVLAAGVLATRWRTLPARLPGLVTAVMIAAVIAAPNIVQLAHERTLFGHLELSNLPDPLPASAWWDVFFRPVSSKFAGTRTLFFGGPLALLAALGCVQFFSRRRDLVVVVIASTILLFAGMLPMAYISARYHLRDPLTLCAVPLGALVLNRWLNGTSRTRRLAHLVVAVECAILVAAAWPLVTRSWDSAGRSAAAWRGATGSTTLVTGIVSRIESRTASADLHSGGRVLYSPRVDHDVAERGLVDDGLGINALAYHGIRVVNGSFKSISTDAIWPDDRLFYGRIRTPQWLILSGESLDVLGVRYVLAYSDEPVAAGLTRIHSATTTRGRELLLFENTDAWTAAFLIGSTYEDDAPVVEGCGNDGVFCRELAPIVPRRDAAAVQVNREGASMRMRFGASSSPRVLVISEMFRKEWNARAGDRTLETRPAYGGLLAVPLPPDVGEVHLEYRPTALRLATLLSYGGLLAGIAAVIPRRRFTWRPRFPRSSTTSDTSISR